MARLSPVLTCSRPFIRPVVKPGSVPRKLIADARPSARCVVMPGRREIASAMLVSGSLPMSSAEMTSEMLCRSAFTWIASWIPARTPVTMTSSRSAASAALADSCGTSSCCAMATPGRPSAMAIASDSALRRLGYRFEIRLSWARREPGCGCLATVSPLVSLCSSTPTADARKVHGDMQCTANVYIIVDATDVAKTPRGGAGAAISDCGLRALPGTGAARTSSRTCPRGRGSSCAASWHARGSCRAR